MLGYILILLQQHLKRSISLEWLLSFHLACEVTIFYLISYDCHICFPLEYFHRCTFQKEYHQLMETRQMCHSASLRKVFCILSQICLYTAYCIGITQLLACVTSILCKVQLLMLFCQLATLMFPNRKLYFIRFSHSLLCKFPLREY